MKKRLAGLLLPALAWGLGVGALGCAEEAPPPAVTAPPVLVAAVEAYRVEELIEATGELIAADEAAIAAQVGGEITEIRFDEGAAVEAGSVVLEIDPERRTLDLRNAEAGVVEAGAQVGEATRELARRKKLHKRGAASEAALDEAQTAVRLARSRREAARARLGLAERAVRDSSVKAPFGGFVARRYVSEGEFVSPGAKLFDLVALDPIEVEFHLAERDSSRVDIGDPVEVRLAPFPDEVFAAAVTFVSPMIDSGTRTLRVKAVVDNHDGRLRPGLFARANLGVEVREGVPMIPEDAVLIRASGSMAFRLVEGDRVERRPVEIGVHRDSLVEVVSGLAVGDRVVVRGQNKLVDGSPVALRDAEGRALDRPSSAASAKQQPSARP